MRLTSILQIFPVHLQHRGSFPELSQRSRSFSRTRNLGAKGG